MKNDSFLKLMLLICAIALITPSFAQISAGGTPPSFNYEQETKSLGSVVDLPLDFDFDALRAEDALRAADGMPPRVGVIVPVNFTTENSGEWTTLPNGQNIWRLGIYAEDAVAIMLLYDKFVIPAGGQLFVYGEDRTEVLGAFTEKNNPKQVEYATDYIEGNYITLEYAPPAGNLESPITITGVVYGYNYLLSKRAEPCMININCPEGNNWQDQKRGVVRLSITIPGQGSYVCSGSIVNNTSGNLDPLLLSAYHCFHEGGGTANYNQLVVRFHYERYTCNGTIRPPNQSITGAELLAETPINSQGADGSLLRLNQNIPESYYAYYNGWDRRNTAATSGVSIHHPAGDDKAISTFNTAATSGTGGYGMPSGSAWTVRWSPTVSGHSVTEGGSSGSPLFNQNKLIVGALSTGSSSCIYLNGTDNYTKLWWNWDQHPTQKMKPYLDPTDSGVEFIEGIYQVAPVIVTVSLSANPTAGGTVTENGNYIQGTSVSIRATPNANYTFQNWTKDGTAVSTNANHTFTVTEDMHLVANFVPRTHTVSILASPTAGGTASGDGTYNYGETVTVTAIPNAGYKFVNWRRGTTVLSTDANYSFTITENVTLIANFEANVGVNDVEKIANFAIYPNPANDMLKIVRATAEKTQIMIYNSMGALVQSLEMNEVETTINISTLSSGVYIIRLTNGESSSTQRFVKE